MSNAQAHQGEQGELIIKEQDNSDAWVASTETVEIKR